MVLSYHLQLYDIMWEYEENNDKMLLYLQDNTIFKILILSSTNTLLADMLSLPVCEGASLIWMSKLLYLRKIFLINMLKNGDLPHLRAKFP